MSSPYLITRQRFINAAPADIFEVLATPALHSVIDGSDTVKGEQPNGPQRLYQGAKFGMDMKIGAKYKILNRVVEFDEGRRITWRHFTNATWSYDLQPRDGGTLVTEEWDARSVKGRIILRPMGFLRKHPGAMDRTLANLESHVTGT